MNTDATPIEIAKADLIKFGMTVDAYTALGADDKFFLTVENNDVTVGSENSTLKGWETIMTEVNKYYTYNNGTWGDKDGLSADEKLQETPVLKLLCSKLTKISWHTIPRKKL